MLALLVVEALRKVSPESGSHSRLLLVVTSLLSRSRVVLVWCAVLMITLASPMLMVVTMTTL